MASRDQEVSVFLVGTAYEYPSEKLKEARKISLDYHNVIPVLYSAALNEPLLASFSDELKSDFRYDPHDAWIINGESAASARRHCEDIFLDNGWQVKRDTKSAYLFYVRTTDRDEWKMIVLCPCLTH